MDENAESVMKNLIKSFQDGEKPKLKETRTKITTVTGKVYEENKTMEGVFTFTCQSNNDSEQPQDSHPTHMVDDPSTMHGFRGDPTWFNIIEFPSIFVFKNY